VPLQSASQLLSIQRGFRGALCQQVWAKSDGQMVLGRIACTSFVDAAYCYTFRSVVSVLGTRVGCAKTDELIASPLGADSCGPKNRVLNWVEIAMKGHFQPAVSYPPPPDERFACLAPAADEWHDVYRVRRRYDFLPNYFGRLLRSGLTKGAVCWLPTAECMQFANI